MAPESASSMECELCRRCVLCTIDDDVEGQREPLNACAAFGAKKQMHIEELLRIIEFFGNPGKFLREKWAVSRLLTYLQKPHLDSELHNADEPLDVVWTSGGLGFQVKEIMDSNRRRQDEYRSKLEHAQQAACCADFLQQYHPKEISFSEIVEACYAKAESLVAENAYGSREVQLIDLLCYHNLVDHHVVPPFYYRRREAGFRSLAVVSNRYCAVLYAKSNAPSILQQFVGMVIAPSKSNGAYERWV